MANVSTGKILDCDGMVLYTPSSDEVDPTLFPLVSHIKETITIPCDAHIDPFMCAKDCIHFAQEKRMCVLVPGMLFDACGTRHGRGGGWYDRFLASIPNEWIRIGITTPRSFRYSDVIHRNPWDEQVDYIAVYDVTLASWEVYEVSLKRPCINT